MAEANLQATSGTAEVTAEVSEFEARLRGGFKPKSPKATTEIETAVQTLARMALSATKLISGDAVRAIEGMIAELDKRMSEQLNLVIHHEDFQKLEGTWSGVKHLVERTGVQDDLRVKVLNVTKKELLKDFTRVGEQFDQGELFRKVYTDEYSQFGAEPYGMLVGDYFFDHSPQDVAFLSGMAKVASSAHAPFVSAVDPRVLDMETWQELPKPVDLAAKVRGVEYAGWRALRESEDSRYLALCMPRFVSRRPYGAKTEPVDEFAFEEDTAGGDHRKYTWTNSAFAMAANVTRSFKEYGWCARIRGVESGGLVEGLKLHSFKTADGKTDFKCPTEVMIDGRREAELSALGMMPLVYRKNSEEAAFIGAQTLNKPTVYDDPDVTGNANLSARLPYIFATCRFAHFLKKMVHDKIGSFKEREDMERWLNDWIANYVVIDPHAGEEIKAKYPLAQAEVTVAEVEGNPGYYTANFFLRPHYQLEGLTASLSLVTKLPSVGGGT